MNFRKRRKLDMDGNSIISAFIASSNQYVVCQNEDNLMQLQRHLEILVCLTTTSSDLELFQSNNPLSSQCITHVINLLLDSNTKFSLIPRVLSILQNLSKCSQLNRNLQSTFHVHSAVSVFLQHYGTDVKDPLVLQCFNLLENVTYNISIDYIESHFGNLINVLISLIDTESTQLLKTSLCILTNITRHNVKIQNYICSLPSSKQSIKKIITMLNTEEPHIVVYALSILANLTPNYPFGAKLWTDEHLMTTFKLIIKLLFAKNETCAIAALDLFLDLIKVPKYQSCFIKSPYLSTFLKRIPKVLSDDALHQSILYLQILFALAEIPDCSEKVCSVLCISDKNSSGDLSNQIINIHPKIIHWCSNKETNVIAHKMSLKLLKCFLNLYIEKNFEEIEACSKEIVNNILSNMSVPRLTDLNIYGKQLEAHISIFEILILLCQKDNMKNFISQHINLTVCEGIVNVLLDLCKIDDIENNTGCIDLFLMILEAVSMIKDLVPESEHLICKILNDFRALQCLAYALSSNNGQHVSRGICLISLISDKTSLHLLSKKLFVRNSVLQKRFAPNSENLDCSVSLDTIHQVPRKTLQCTSDSYEKSIDSLLSKVEKSLNIKELKKSEIMDLYEHKIAILTRKEQELQNYVEAKTAALLKADQIMTQYKCRQADSDAEAMRLRHMLKDYESRSERALFQFEEAQKACMKQKEELDAAFCKIKELQQYQNEQKDLMQSQISRQYEQKKIFEEEKARLSELLYVKDCDKKALTNQLQQMEEDIKLKCKAYEALEESKDELLKKIEELQKCTEKMKQNFEQKNSDLESALDSAQQTISSLEEKNDELTNEMSKKIDEFTEQILELENDKEELNEQIKIKDIKIADLNESIKKLNASLNEKCCALKEVEVLNEELKSVLEKAENKNSKFEQDVKMLEMLCKRYETSIEKKESDIKSLTEELEDVRKQCEEDVKEKDNEIKNLEAELEKHKYITGMIHQITSGKIPPPNK